MDEVLKISAPVLQAFAIKDLKADVFMSPFFCGNARDAIRNATVEAQNPESLLCKFSGDFALFHIGTFDANVGMLQPVQHPVLVVPISQLTTQASLAAKGVGNGTV